MQIPNFKKKKKSSAPALTGNEKKMLLTDKSAWPVQEAYKALRTNITFSLPNSGCKVVAVSSAQAHDGKSINTINSAIAFGQLDKKVLLIDCDLRLPTVAHKLGLNGAPGLSDLLVGEAEIGQVLQRETAYGIDVIPAGNLPPDPTWLLQSEQMKRYLNELRKYYEYIFIDLPPVMTVADASIMAQYTDGFLIVVRHEVTDTRAIADTLNQLRLAGAKVLGFIYNDVTQGGGKYYSKYYKSYYR